jgi:hypothetical protein
MVDLFGLRGDPREGGCSYTRLQIGAVSDPEQLCSTI